MASVRLAGICKAYSGTAALHPLDLDIRDGEFLSILGPSGSGKTTLLRIVAGFVKPDGGSVSIGGREVSALPPERRNLGVVFQSYALFPHMTVLDNVAFGLRMRGLAASQRRAQAAEALGQVGLSGFEDRLPRQLSGGQQQRVALARAIVIDPDVMLLDEPLGALDLKLRKSMQLELKQLHREVKRTFIYVTHDQEEALTMSDRVAVMDGGRLLQIDPPEAIYRDPASAFVAEFLGESNLLPGRSLGRDGAGNVRFVGEGGAACSAPGQEISAGAAALLAVRPERVRLGPAGGDGEISVAATVEAVTFKGAFVSVLGRLSDGTSCQALIVDDGRGGAVPTPGAAVTFVFSSADARVLGGRR